MRANLLHYIQFGITYRISGIMFSSKQNSFLFMRQKSSPFRRIQKSIFSINIKHRSVNFGR